MLELGGGPGGGGQKIGPHPRESDDGKRFPAVDVVSGLLLGENFLKMGGGPGGGGPIAGPDEEDSDFFLCLKIAVLLAWQLTLAPFSRKLSFSVLQKTRFYLHGSPFFNNSYFFVNFCVFEGSLEIAVLPAWELHLGEVSPHIFRFFDILRGPEKSICCFTHFS